MDPLKLSRFIAIAWLLVAPQALAQLGPDGGKIVLETANAKMKGERLQYNAATKTVTGLAPRAAESISWQFQVKQPGWYQVVVHYALKDGKNLGNSVWNATIGDQNRLGPIHATGASDRFLPQVLFNPMELTSGGHELKLQWTGSTKPLDLSISKIELVRAREPGIP